MASTKARVQKFGNAMSAMVMPNIGAFIAWGIIAALFIPAGYFPNETLNRLVEPTLKYLLPILIGRTAGSNIYGRRGGVAGAIATIGVIVGSDVTMLVGGMIMDPLGAVVIRWFDRLVEGKIKSGLEMLVDNFSLGILEGIMMIFGLLIVAPVYGVINAFLIWVVTWLEQYGLLQLSSIFVVPAQLLFLNNAVNHGIFSPLGLQQVAETGKSVLFLIEANGGPWTGLALAFALFGKGMARQSAPGACLIQFLGGIGEVVFPYALIKPATMLGPITGHVFANYWFSFLGGGTVGPVSPGSLPALIMMSARGSLLTNVSGYFISGAISFLVVSLILKRDRTPIDATEPAAVEAVPVKPSAALTERPEREETPDAGQEPADSKRNIEKIYFCCDAGMGSSVMAASILTTQLNKEGFSVKVDHASLSEIPTDADVVVCSEALYDRAVEQAPEGVLIFKLSNLMDQNEHAALARTLRKISEPESRSEMTCQKENHEQ